MSRASGSRGCYSHPRWINLARKVVRERPFCECGCGQPSAHADHRTPIKDPHNLADPMIWDRGNIQALSSRCHRQKSRVEQGEDGRLSRVKQLGPKIIGCDAKGYPLDPNHAWNLEAAKCRR